MDIKWLLEFRKNRFQDQCVEPETPVAELLSKISEGGANCVLVVEKTRLVGIVTKHDLVYHILLKKRQVDSYFRVLNMMTPNPVTVTPKCTLEAALQIFINHEFDCLPVVDESGILHGVVTLEDVVEKIINSYDSLLGYTLDNKLSSEFLQKNQRNHELVDPIQEAIIANVHHKILNFHQSLIGSLKSDLREIHTNIEASGLDLTNLNILFCTVNSKSQRVTRMALSSTGAKLDSTLEYERGRELIYQNNYDMVIVDKEMINLAAIARDRNPKTKIVFLTFDNPAEYIPLLAPYPYIQNIVSLSQLDYKFSVKGVLSTIRKITTGDIFGLEKYLESGTKVESAQILGSDHRIQVLQTMKNYFKQLGLTKGLISRVTMVAEELLLNAIYDAPIDRNGKSVYNRLDRRIAVKLKENEQGTFCYACDGSYIGIAAQDPFGSISKATVFRYLQSCYSEKAGTLDIKKGGAGRGLFMIVEGADLVVFNVKPNAKTEVAAFFAIDKNEAKKIGRSSLHYFTDAA